MTEPAAVGAVARQLNPYWELLRRRKLIIAEVVAIVLATALALHFTAPVEYEGSAQVLISYDDLPAALLGGTARSSNVFLEPGRIAETQAQLARVPEVFSEVAASPAAASLTPEEIRHRSSVSAGANSDLLTFRFRSRDRERAFAVAVAYAQAFSRYRSQLDTAPIARALADVRSQIADLRRAGSPDTDLLSNFLAKEQELRTLAALQTSKAMPITSSEAAVQVSPRPLRQTVLIAAALGLFLGFLQAFLWDRIDTRVKSPAAIAGSLGLPLLGEIPIQVGKRTEIRRLVMLSEPEGRDADAVRILRSNLDFAGIDRKLSKVLIVSATPGEGKSTVAANLALAEARAGRRVILVDLDVRRPTQHRNFGVSLHPGITDVARGLLSLEEALIDVELSSSFRGHDLPGSARLLPAGSMPPNPADFVASRAVARLLDEAAGMCDVAIVDSPPVLNISDAYAIARQVDGVVVVARMGAAKRDVLEELRHQLGRFPAPSLGVVVVGVRRQKSDYYSHYEASDDRSPLTYSTGDADAWGDQR